jgi:hypothetical protein
MGFTLWTGRPLAPSLFRALEDIDFALQSGRRPTDEARKIIERIWRDTKRPDVTREPIEKSRMRGPRVFRLSADQAHKYIDRVWRDRDAKRPDTTGEPVE